MIENNKLTAFAKYAWFALAYNLVVILWGVFLRASYSGDGCGQHWITCHGEAIPSAPELKTLIEFSHRVTSMLAGLVVIGLVIWAFRKFEKRHLVRRLALLSLVFILIEGAIGGGLVLTGNTAANWTPSRPYWTAGHLINTFVLIGLLGLTAWFASGDRRFVLRGPAKVWILLALGIAAIFVTGISGSMAALTNMLFPSETLAEGIAKDFDPNSHILLRLRILHPIFSIFTAVFLIFLSDMIRKAANKDALVSKWANVVSILVIVQIIFGGATLLLLAPIVMQLGHLLLADLIWISFVLMGASVFTAGRADQL
ncbi:MAG TPA: COX15/CtaA family protein [Pyrinomonadaceae bacterium]|nr:COX15/CtaA family protein [Chloracidobacterium sp.]HRJ88687.1 COX15/CtaA family protein [Pyrinomonadaceae bacterium]HRK49028.1 COX15/CtaA family protein [Pyrinomonadaceae bacterium]